MRKKKCNNKVNPLTTRESEFSESGVHPMYYPVFRNTFKNDEFRYYLKKKKNPKPSFHVSTNSLLKHDRANQFNTKSSSTK